MEAGVGRLLDGVKGSLGLEAPRLAKGGTWTLLSPLVGGGQGGLPERQTMVVLRVAVAKMPVPDETNAWRELLDFKAGHEDKQWSFPSIFEGPGYEGADGT